MHHAVLSIKQFLLIIKILSVRPPFPSSVYGYFTSVTFTRLLGESCIEKAAWICGMYVCTTSCASRKLNPGPLRVSPTELSGFLHLFAAMSSFLKILSRIVIRMYESIPVRYLLGSKKESATKEGRWFPQLILLSAAVRKLKELEMWCRLAVKSAHSPLWPRSSDSLNDRKIN